MLDHVKHQINNKPGNVPDSGKAAIPAASGNPKIASSHNPRQRSIRTPISCLGIGLHSGVKTSMRIKPAPENHGIVFLRTDIPGSAEHKTVPALWNNVNFTTLCSQISNAHGTTVSTIEHFMAACAALEIDNLLIEIDGGEVPIMDGSAAPFIFLLECAGMAQQQAARRCIQVLKTVTVSEKNGHGYKHASISPCDDYTMQCSIEFQNTAIGRQEYRLHVSPSSFKNDIARARTFGFFHEVEQMRAQGLALGGSLENSVVLDQDGVMNPGGLRFADEFVRHKILDCIGDLYLAGHPFLGHVETHRSGHGLNNRLLRELFADKSAWRLVEVVSPSLVAANDMTFVEPKASLQA